MLQSSLLCVALCALAPSGVEDLDYEGLAKQHLAAAGLSDLPATSDSFERWLEADYVAGSLGLSRVLFPRRLLSERAHAGQLQEVSLGLVDLQLAWLERFGGEGAEDARDALQDLRKFVKAAKPRAAEAERGTDLIAALGGGDAERAVARRAFDALVAADALGHPLQHPQGARVLFAPTRTEFLEVVSVLGYFAPSFRSSYWQEHIRNWTECYQGDVQVVALEYPSSKKEDAATVGEAMDRREPKGLLEHVVQRGAHSLCRTFFEFALDPAFESGLCQDLVIAVLGSNNARSGGSGRGRETEGWETFVPGGASQGGLLPPNDADSRWRATKGEDHFIRALVQSQKSAGRDHGKGKEDKLTWFELRTGEGAGGATAVQAPFFGPEAASKELPPAAFLTEYREFFRAYKTAFAYWLVEHQAGKKKSAESRARVAELFRKVAAAQQLAGDDSSIFSDPTPVDFPALVAEVYGVPWGGGAGTESLEMAFLAWLAKQK